MPIKDYYKILDVPPAATLQEIKRSFRQLAQQYHPDKNDGSQSSSAYYSEIQEAYKVLSDPKQREDYNYKRWFNRTSGQAYVKQLLTPVDILQECRSLQRYMASINVFHVRYETVAQHIEQLFSAATVHMLQENEARGINPEIVRLVLRSADPLPLPWFERVANVLRPLEPATVATAWRTKKRRHLWEKYRWVVVLVVTATILMLMRLL